MDRGRGAPTEAKEKWRRCCFIAQSSAAFDSVSCRLRLHWVAEVKAVWGRDGNQSSKPTTKKLASALCRPAPFMVHPSYEADIMAFWELSVRTFALALASRPNRAVA